MIIIIINKFRIHYYEINCNLIIMMNLTSKLKKIINHLNKLFVNKNTII